MDINANLANLSAVDKVKLDMQIEAFNKSLREGKGLQQELGKDEFMKILITQLQHQDPTKPMEDREFIAQMAQFSSLEQMSEIKRQFVELSATLKASRATNLIGRRVEIGQGDSAVSGTVTAVTGGAYPQLLVDGRYYDFDDITRITE